MVYVNAIIIRIVICIDFRYMQEMRQQNVSEQEAVQLVIQKVKATMRVSSLIIYECIFIYQFHFQSSLSYAYYVKI